MSWCRNEPRLSESVLVPHRVGCIASRVKAPAQYRLPKVVDELAGRQDVDCGQIVCTGGVVMVAMYCEDRQARLKSIAVKICLPAVSEIVMRSAL